MSDEQHGLWLHDYFSPYDAYAHGITRVLHHDRTPYQDCMIVESGVTGKALVLDGKWQSCTGDEYLYHEPLIHPACLMLAARGTPPRRVLILGGGEGATLREVLRWTSVERAVMIDLDGEVVEACKQHLPEMHRGAWDDPRAELVIANAIEYVADPANRPAPAADDAGGWDLVISDLTDPIEKGPSYELFTQEFYESVKGAMHPDGVLVVQSGSTSPYEMQYHARLNATLKACFARTRSVVTYVPTYLAPWSFVLASDSSLAVPAEVTAVDAMLAEHLSNPFEAAGDPGLRMFDGTSLVGLLHTAKHLRDALERETTVYTKADPPTFFGSGVAE